MSNYEKRIAKRNRRIQRDVMEMAKSYGADYLNELTTEDKDFLSKATHPSIEDLNGLDYVTWMCEHGYHKKAKAFAEQILTPVEL